MESELVDKGDELFDSKLLRFKYYTLCAVSLVNKVLYLQRVHYNFWYKVYQINCTRLHVLLTKVVYLDNNNIFKRS